MVNGRIFYPKNWGSICFGTEGADASAVPAKNLNVLKLLVFKLLFFAIHANAQNFDFKRINLEYFVNLSEEVKYLKLDIDSSSNDHIRMCVRIDYKKVKTSNPKNSDTLDFYTIPILTDSNFNLLCKAELFENSLNDTFIEKPSSDSLHMIHSFYRTHQFHCYSFYKNHSPKLVYLFNENSRKTMWKVEFDPNGNIINTTKYQCQCSEATGNERTINSSCTWLKE